MKLWFENHLGIRRQIADCDTWKDVCYYINEFIKQANENKPASAQRFKSYYMRTWKEDSMTKIDVGSHTEFFYWEGQINSIAIMENGEAVIE